MDNRDPWKLSKGDQRPRECDDGASVESGPRENLTEEVVAELRALGMRIGLFCRRGNAQAAHALVDNAIAAMRPQLESPMLLLTLAEVGIDVRCCNTLEARGVLTVKQLLHADRNSLLAIPNFGEVSMIGIFAQITLFALNRAMDLEERLLGRCG